ncbi:hypothetical protein H072_296 [Dactylellina haptotyla CBS 200.50]|uniref:Uncharacterized protein n=1 Tax=Dactylellina haptotyla (strain CBS 200.50) TaxID=1284197 RepID=S8AXY5_DACHA|nr:hypothetical protein H072_296 [Dactylellina haptotyla CBS 200.50]
MLNIFVYFSIFIAIVSGNDQAHVVIPFNINFDTQPLGGPPIRIAPFTFPQLSIQKGSTIPKGGTIDLKHPETNYLQACSNANYGTVELANLKATTSPGPTFLLPDGASSLFDLSSLCFGCSIKIPSVTATIPVVPLGLPDPLKQVLVLENVVIPVTCVARIIGMKVTAEGEPETVGTEIMFKAPQLTEQIAELVKGLSAKPVPMVKASLPKDWTGLTSVMITIKNFQPGTTDIDVPGALGSLADDEASAGSFHLDDIAGQLVGV